MPPPTALPGHSLTVPCVPQLLFQETNPGVRYQYTIQRPADSENEIEQPEFLWRFGSWTTCTATCGTGECGPMGHPL